MKPNVLKKISSVITLIIILIMLVPLVHTGKSTSAVEITDKYYNVKNTHFLHVNKTSFAVNVKLTEKHYLCHIKLKSRMEFYLFDMYAERFICSNGSKVKSMRQPRDQNCLYIDNRIENLWINLMNGNATMKFANQTAQFLVNERKEPHKCPNFMRNYCKPRIHGKRKHMHRAMRRFCHLLYPSYTKTKSP